MLAGIALVLAADFDPVGGSARMRGAAIAATALVVPLAVGAMARNGMWWRIALFGGVVAGPLRALFYDPYLDPGCVVCRHSAAALSYHPGLARALLIGGALLTSLAVLGMARRSRERWTVLLLVGVAFVAAWSIWRPEAVVAGAIAASAVGIDCYRTVVSRRRLRNLVRVLRADGLEQTLRDALADPSLRVAYWLADEDRFAAPDGGDPPVRSPAQTATELFAGPILVGVVYHDPAIAEVAALAGVLDGPARLSLANERLAAQLGARVLEVHRSRVRLIELADAERRQLERDVHDGAQQHVLTLGFDLRIAATDPTLDAPTRQLIDRCLAETMLALDDLRELSHGLYPPSLDAGGLTSALRGLARRSDVPVRFGQLPTARLPSPFERTVFALIADAASAADHELVVDVDVSDSSVEVVIDGTEAPPDQVVLDRIEALAGRLTRHGNSLTVTIPCVS
jgi:signal transduction histidine kinase